VLPSWSSERVHSANDSAISDSVFHRSASLRLMSGPRKHNSGSPLNLNPPRKRESCICEVPGETICCRVEACCTCNAAGDEKCLNTTGGTFTHNSINASPTSGGTKNNHLPHRQCCTSPSCRGFGFDGDCSILECLLGGSFSHKIIPDPMRHPALSFCSLEL